LSAFSKEESTLTMSFGEQWKFYEFSCVWKGCFHPTAHSVYLPPKFHMFLYQDCLPVGFFSLSSPPTQSLLVSLSHLSWLQLLNHTNMDHFFFFCMSQSHTFSSPAGWMLLLSKGHLLKKIPKPAAEKTQFHPYCCT
jgi:hypothetical protein